MLLRLLQESLLTPGTIPMTVLEPSCLVSAWNQCWPGGQTQLHNTALHCDALN